MIEMTGVESKIEGLIQVLHEGDNKILEICRSGRLTMRRGHHTSSVMRAMGAGEADPLEPQLEAPEDSAANEPE